MHRDETSEDKPRTQSDGDVPLLEEEGWFVVPYAFAVPPGWCRRASPIGRLEGEPATSTLGYLDGICIRAIAVLMLDSFQVEAMHGHIG